MFTDDQKAHAETVLDACREAGLRLAVAESCTGWLITGCLTAVAGSSDVVERGFVVYTNEAKRELLGVPAAVFDDAARDVTSHRVNAALQSASRPSHQFGHALVVSVGVG